MKVPTPALRPKNPYIDRRGGRGMYKKGQATELAVPDQNGVVAVATRKPQRLPEYLSHEEINAMIRAAPTEQARLLMLLQWRGGLRISEALHLRPADVRFDSVELFVRQGKGNKDRLVRLHTELAQALGAAIGFAKIKVDEPIVGVARMTAHRWYKQALVRCQASGMVFEGRRVTTHTLRHSAARHWLVNGVPMNVVQLWLGHANLRTTEIYTKLISDPGTSSSCG